MPIVEADIKYYLSGGAGNSDPNASLGGAISSTEVVDASLHNLFDKVLGDEAAAGDTEYRAIFVKNTHATLTWEAVKLWIVSQPDGRTTKESFELAKETSSGSPIQTVADEDTSPTGVTFSAPSSKSAGIDLGDIGPGVVYGFWFKRIVPANCEAKDSAQVQIKCEGDSPE